MKPYDHTRTVIATLGDDKYTTKQIADALGGHLNTAQCLRDLAKNKEIERVGKEGCHTIWRTIKLHPVRQHRPARTPRSPDVLARIEERKFLSVDIEPNTQAALRLHAALDAMTRNHQQGAAR